MKTYNTSDIVLATTLIYLGVNLKEAGLHQRNDKRLFFSFENTEEVEETIRNFWNKEIRVEPKQWSYIFRELKGRVYELQNKKDKMLIDDLEL